MITSGCSANLKNTKPYSNYINKPLTLKSPAKLYEKKLSKQNYWHGKWPVKPGTLYDIVGSTDEEFQQLSSMVNFKDSPYGHITLLPKGTSLRINKVFTWTDVGGMIEVRGGRSYFR